jgi:microsomal dipeptidase-like Zn-dependent dipeptidase
LGPDFIDYCLEVMTEALKGMAYDSGETFRYPRGAEDTSKLLNITRGMVARGYSDQDIENVLGGSMLLARKGHWIGDQDGCLKS